MKLTRIDTNKNWDEGAYGTVFFDYSTAIAYKVFKARNDVSYEHIKKTFLNETDAYRRAQKCNQVKNYIPEFYGEENLTKIVTEQNKDISCEYYLDLNYKMELIQGRFIKLGNLLEQKSMNLKSLFKNIGIENLDDASAILDENNEIFKIIDFSTGHIEIWLRRTIQR